MRRRKELKITKTNIRVNDSRINIFFLITRPQIIKPLYINRFGLTSVPFVSHSVEITATNSGIVAIVTILMLVPYPDSLIIFFIVVVLR